MRDYEDMIFQAHCQIEYLMREFEDGARLESCADDIVTLILRDGSEMMIYLDPIAELVKELRGLPPHPARR